MRKGVLLAAVMLLGAGIAQAQVVSPLGGSTTMPQSAPPATRTPAAPTAAAPTAPAPATAAPAPTAAAPGASATPPAVAAPAHTRRSFAERFQAANTTHDGKLTLEQARTGRMRSIVRDFDQIDTAKRGYVTLDQVKAHQAAMRAAHRAAEAKPATH